MYWWKQRKVETFSVPIKKVITKIDKKGNETVDTVSYKMKFIDSIRFMERSLSNLVDNLTEGIYKIKYKDCNCFLEYKVSRTIQWNINAHLAIKIIQAILMKN